MGDHEHSSDGAETITALLNEVSLGDRTAESQLISVVYDELRRVAARHMMHERYNHTLQPTALVNEVYLRLLRQQNIKWQNRAHFFGIAAQLMRRVLIEYARTRTAGKRGGVQRRVALEEHTVVLENKPTYLADLDEALTRLEQIDPRQTRIVELRFFGGLSVEEIATVLHISPRSVRRDWSSARAWLYGQMSKG
jgi:RNA polymerase sigma-70 factor (ECF subfamily)